jgi:hypothetical protein
MEILILGLLLKLLELQKLCARYEAVAANKCSKLHSGSLSFQILFKILIMRYYVRFHEYVSGLTTALANSRTFIIVRKIDIAAVMLPV